ncbi:MAG TPA: ribonucleoside-diphosphate reductase subunit alpha, partial [Campylobacterales bacterium]|nr:ribonucleoside-diphosphate reductase subunit alpha [Campylobacterales bacterium]
NYDLDDLNEYIKPQRDLQFTYLGIKTLYDRYLLKDKNGKPIELPQHMFMAVAMFLAQNELDSQGWAKKFYDILSKFEVMAATPTLSNARTPRHQLSSCYIGSSPDNIEGIFDGYKEMALLSKYGGGIGWDWTKVRGMGSFIDGHKNAAGGIVPFLKITNDIAIAVDQLGTRKGAIAVYIEPWHIDILDFIDLKKNSGEERRRAHDLFPALWINDLFMKRVEKDEVWTLFDPYETQDLTDVWGEEFEKRYIEYEKKEGIIKEKIKAKELWKKILLSYFETGNPFLCFKDNANRCNPNSHRGIIRSSNLCTEIFQNTEPNYYKIRVKFEDGTVIYFDENDEVEVDGGIVKKAKKITSLDSINTKRVFIVDKEKIDGDTAVCNLASVNLSKVNTKEDIERVVPIAIRMLDNVIDLNFYPLEKVKKTNLKTRAIGLGVMGEAQMLAEQEIEWGSDEHFQKIDEIMEAISYNAIKASSNLAIEKGKYPEFNGSSWSQGIMPIDVANKEAKKLTPNRGGLFGYIYDWNSLREKVKKDGMRNGYLMAIAPTSSISILTGTTQTIEPVYKRKWFEENLSGLIPVVVPNLNIKTWKYYAPAYDLDQKILIKAASVRQKWIDQGQSTNIFIRLDKASGKYLHEIYMLAWKLGLKSTYYLRSQSPEAANDVADRSMECLGCQ